MFVDFCGAGLTHYHCFVKFFNQKKKRRENFYHNQPLSVGKDELSCAKRGMAFKAKNLRASGLEDLTLARKTTNSLAEN